MIIKMVLYKATTMLAQKNDKSKTSCCASKAKACSSDKASANKEESLVLNQKQFSKKERKKSYCVKFTI